ISVRLGLRPSAGFSAGFTIQRFLNSGLMARNINRFRSWIEGGGNGAFCGGALARSDLSREVIKQTSIQEERIYMKTIIAMTFVGAVLLGGLTGCSSKREVPALVGLDLK